ncbi:MAG: hypothetical protein ACYDIC_05705 [Desulfobaccales bacterium]
MPVYRHPLWAALVALALGATLLHLRIHPPSHGLTYVWPNFFAAVDLVAVSLLFLRRSTAILGLLLNSFLAFLGIIMMADFSLSATLAGKMQPLPQADFFGWLLATTISDIAILLADFLVGLALYRALMAEPR